MKKKNWYKLDLVGTFYAFAKDSSLTAVLRFSAEMKEEVDKEILQQALEETIKDFPHFNVTLRRGVFWNYLETVPFTSKVEEERKRVCAQIYLDGKALYRVSYYKKRINFEASHILTDGKGATSFLNRLLSHYLNMKEGIPLKVDDASSIEERSENSFEKNYLKGKLTFPPKNKVYNYHKKKNKYPKYTEYHISVKDIKALAKEAGVTITLYLLAVYFYSFKEEMRAKDFKKAVRIDVPVDLRTLYGSETTRNYISYLPISYKFKGKDESFESILENIKRIFNEEFDKDKLYERVNNLFYLEKNIFTRAVPLFVKDFVFTFVNKINSNRCSAVLSNVGIIKIQEDMEDYISNINVFNHTDKIKLTMISYKDDLSIGINNAYLSNNLMKHFVRFLASRGIHGTVNMADWEVDDE